MKKVLVAAAVAGLFGTANAQSAFDGINAQIGVGMGNISSQNSASYSIVDPNSGTYTGSGNSNSSSKANVFGMASIGYSYGFSNKFNLAANIFYLGGSNDMGTSSSTDTDADGYVDNASQNLKLKNIWGISVEPGYNFTNTSLGFLKLGWAQAKIEGNGSATTNDPDAFFSSSSYTASANTQGFLYGLGFKQMLDKNIYIGVEAFQIQFANKSGSGSTSSSGVTLNQTLASKPLVTYVGVNLGYRF